MPTSGFSIEPLKVKLLAGEQKATENRCSRLATVDAVSKRGRLTALRVTSSGSSGTGVLFG